MVLPRFPLIQVAALALLPALAAAQTAPADAHADALFEQMLVDLLLDDPEAVTQLGLHDRPALASLRSALTDVSPAQEHRFLVWARAYVPQVAALDRDALSPSRRVSADVAGWYLDHVERGEPFLYHDYPVNQLFGVQNALLSVFTTHHTVADAASAEAYVTRLSRVGVKMDQLLASLRLREERGVVPPRVILDKVAAGLERFLEPTPDENVLVTAFERRLADVDGMSDAVRSALVSNAEAEVRGTVLPAYQSLLDYVTALAAEATDAAGVWTLPDGDAYYAHRLRYYTTTDYTPNEVHQMGIDEVARIEGELARVLTDLGVEGETVLDQMRAFPGAPKRPDLYTDDEAGRAAVRAAIEGIYEETAEGMTALFDRVPAAPLEVRRIPEHLQDTSPNHYNAPALDGSRPGIFFLNQKWAPSGFTVAGVRPLAYHEGIPGHHYQLALQQEIEGLPLLRQSYISLTAYVEGWALYAEQLAVEHGFFPEPESEVAQLQSQLYRAVRLVVDTGIHHKRWTREEAIDYMGEHLTWPRQGFENEVDRYTAWPGQACSYMVGMLHIMELRERAREALGDEFDIRQFHNVVLEDGSVPLSLLEDAVDDWILAESTR